MSRPQDTRDMLALLDTARAFRMAGQLRDAVLTCDAAIRIAPTYALAWLERGFVLAAGGSMDKAEQSYRKAIALDTTLAPAYAGLATIAARNGRHEEGRIHAVEALALERTNVIASLALATIELELGRASLALTTLDAVKETLTEPSGERSAFYTTMGDILDRLGRYDDAFAAYEQANADFQSVHAASIGVLRRSPTALIEAVIAGLEQQRHISWSSLPMISSKAAKNHVFLTGYPRSGTTLLENILASLDGASALEERPTLAEADSAFLDDPIQGMATLALIDGERAKQYVDAYWSRVYAALNGSVPDLFVDMDPLKGIRLPIIARLFGTAKIVLIRRDPRECVWSCFKTNFALTSAGITFTSLEATARHYSAMMRLIDLCLESLPMRAHVVRYDALVHDFDATTQALCAFLERPWSPALRSFDITARRRGVATASASQVRKGLYDGRRQWEPYRAHMEAIMPILEPWINKWGFSG